MIHLYNALDEVAALIFLVQVFFPLYFHLFMIPVAHFLGCQCSPTVLYLSMEKHFCRRWLPHSLFFSITRGGHSVVLKDSWKQYWKWSQWMCTWETHAGTGDMFPKHISIAAINYLLLLNTFQKCYSLETNMKLLPWWRGIVCPQKHVDYLLSKAKFTPEHTWLVDWIMRFCGRF